MEERRKEGKRGEKEEKREKQGRMMKLQMSYFY
jgi:hypothetical protein